MKILGVKVDDIDLQQAIGKAESWLKSGKSKIFTIVTPNPEIIVQAQNDLQLRKILNAADLAIPDGVGLRLAGIKNTVPGVKLMRELCALAAEERWVVGLYGGRGKAAKEALGKLQKDYLRLKGWSYAPSEIELAQNYKHMRAKLSKEAGRVADKLRKSGTRLLFIGLGAPKQEYFSEQLRKLGESVNQIISESDNQNIRNSDKFSGFVAMGVGGSFDEISGKARQAPEWVSRAGFKWLWRLIWQPWRIKRQLRLLKFVYLVIGERWL